MANRLFRRLSSASIAIGGDPNDAQPAPTWFLGSQERLAASREFGGSRGFITAPPVAAEFSVVAFYGPPPNGMWITDLNVGTTTNVRYGHNPADLIASRNFVVGVSPFLSYWGDEIEGPAQTLANLSGTLVQDPLFPWLNTSSTVTAAPTWWARMSLNAAGTGTDYLGHGMDLPIYVPPSSGAIGSPGFFVIGEGVNLAINVNFAVRFIPWRA